MFFRICMILWWCFYFCCFVFWVCIWWFFVNSVLIFLDKCELIWLSSSILVFECCCLDCLWVKIIFVSNYLIVCSGFLVSMVWLCLLRRSFVGVFWSSARRITRIVVELLFLWVNLVIWVFWCLIFCLFFCMFCIVCLGYCFENFCFSFRSFLRASVIGRFNF